MLCVTSASFSLSINGNVHGYFKGKRGLRQGDPLSPYLFTLVMEVLTSLFQKAAQEDLFFRYHAKCEKQRLINLCFADDLFIFARGDPYSMRMIMDNLLIFSRISGLVPSIQKSMAFFCNVPNHLQMNILDILPFEKGSLPVKYLGVPLITSGLKYSDCHVLVDKMEKRIQDWKNKYLSFAGRCQLIISVLSSMHIYWASVFTLPTRIIKNLEAKMRGFLWCQGPMLKGKAKLAWVDVCVPKNEGGLGIRRIGEMNVALMANHIWNILTHQSSLWVDWIHMHRLHNKNFWAIPMPRVGCYSWRKILNLRPGLRKFIWSIIGDGNRTSAWFDNWSDAGPLSDLISSRTIRDAGLRLEDKVSDIVSHAEPPTWKGNISVLNVLNPPMLRIGVADRMVWKDGDSMSDFAPSVAWNSIRSKAPQVSWFRWVWSTPCIPRYSYHVWLIMRGKLLTQDRILKWSSERRKNMNMMCCPLCIADFDSHAHLFFECNYAFKVWSEVNVNTSLKHRSNDWGNIAEYMTSNATSKSLIHIIDRLVLATSAYYIWQERNNRLFRNQLRPPETLSKEICDTVRLKLLGIKIKENSNTFGILRKWKIGDRRISDDGG